MLNHDLYILVKCIEKTKEAIGRKFPEFASEQLGDLRLINAQQRRCLRLSQAVPFQDLNDTLSKT